MYAKCAQRNSQKNIIWRHIQNQSHALKVKIYKMKKINEDCLKSSQ